MKLPAIAATALLLATAPAGAVEPTIDWATVGSWAVRVDPTIGDGCFVVSSYEDGTSLRIGLHPGSNSSYAMIGNADWASLEQGSTYELKLQFDQRQPWSVQAPVINLGEYPFLMMRTRDARFLQQFAKGLEFSVHHRGQEIARLTLQGSHAATREMLACQEAMNGSAPSGGKAPYTVTPTPTDPFA